MPSLRVKAKTVLTAAGSLPSGAITSTSGILSTGLKKCMPTTRSALRRLGADAGDRQRRGVGGEDGVRRHVLRRLGEDLLLDAQVLDDRLDHQVDPREARSSRAWAGAGPSCAATPGALEPPALHLLGRTARAACCMPLASASSRTSFMRTGRSVLSAMSWAMPPPMTPAPSTAVDLDLPRLGAGQAGLLLGLLRQVEDVDRGSSPIREVASSATARASASKPALAPSSMPTRTTSMARSGAG